MTKVWMVIFLVCLATQTPCICEEPNDKLSAERVIVDAKLREQSNQVILAVNGLCCRNCAIGIGKKVCNLDFVDTEALPKGVKVDRKNSLLSVAIKENEKVDIPSLAKAIRKAGYSPVRLYQPAENGVLKVTEISDDL